MFNYSLQKVDYELSNELVILQIKLNVNRIQSKLRMISVP